VAGRTAGALAGWSQVLIASPEGGVLSGELGAPVHLERDPVALAARLPANGGLRESMERVAQALSELSRAGICVSDFTLGQASLDEVFLALTGNRADADSSEMEVIA
jgi:ABC-2 type transport system ATP-binding protein